MRDEDRVKCLYLIGSGLSRGESKVRLGAEGEDLEGIL
jgi:hypothetical protein